MVELDQRIGPDQPIARFYFRDELDEYGWQFDHFHFEILKKAPIGINPSITLTDRHFVAHTLECKTPEQLNKHYYHPIEFLNRFIN